MMRLLASLLTLALWAAPIQAALEIEISGGVEGALPIAVVPFGWEDPTTGPPEAVGRIIADDLRRSGQFAPLSEGSLPSQPHERAEVNFVDWRSLGVNHLVVGRTRPVGDGTYKVQFELFDVFQGEPLVALAFPVGAEDLRAVAHHIADIIYEKLTGTRGAFGTRIAYVTTEGRGDNALHRLAVADSDGYNPRTILESREPLMSPAWSPDGSKLAYVSFESGKGQIFVQEVATGQRQLVADFPGVNGAPAFSPDGRRLALTLSKDGDLEIYILELATGRLTRLTDSTAIDTEPTWAPDGQTIVFTSDRGGEPQLYEVTLAGGTPRRLTFEGDYNARPRLSPDGRELAMVHRSNGRFRIAVLDLDTNGLRVLTDGALDESPSFAPNGTVLLYATQQQGRGILAAVTVDGRMHQVLRLTEGEVREPAWSPFQR